MTASPNLIPVRSGGEAGAIEQACVGQLTGRDVGHFVLRNARGSSATIGEYGAMVSHLVVPDAYGEWDDVVLGFDDLASYLGAPHYFGATVGRVANRIAGASFSLDGNTYALRANEGRHHLHGGFRGLDKVVWTGEAELRPEGPTVILRHHSAHLDEGYPGAVELEVEYTLTHDDALEITFRATGDQTTALNLTHHGYWNLGGKHVATILEHELQVFSDFRSEVDRELIPTGRALAVADTPFDFRRPKSIGLDLAHAGGDPPGYDTNFLVRNPATDGSLRPVARVREPIRGRVMDVLASASAVQLYTGNHLDGTLRSGDRTFVRHAGLCLETQEPPDAIHDPAWRERVIVRPAVPYLHRVSYRFGTTTPGPSQVSPGA